MTTTLLLLHGMGGTGALWNSWQQPLAQHWPGGWIAPDLAGHGQAAPLSEYTFHEMADAVAATLEPTGSYAILGHSLGGVLGLALAGRGLDVTAVVGLGIKVAWSADELAKAQSLAQRPVSWFDSRAEAAARYLRVTGLTGLLDPTDPVVDAGLREQDGRWRLAMDPAAFGVGEPDMAALVAGATCPVTLARGDGDAMMTAAQLAALVAEPVTLPGLGHNAHVEDSAACAAALLPYLS